MNAGQAGISRRSAVKAGAVAAAGLLLGAGPASPARARPIRLRRPWQAVLTVAQQAGQRVVYSYPGPTPPESLLTLIEAGQVGGVIFFGENITGLPQIADVVQRLKTAHAAGPVISPLLLMTDQEGGAVRRLRGEPPLLSEKQIGLSADPVAAASQAGEGAGTALAQVGMNLNLAPVLDVFRTPGGFDDRFGRSYGSDPQAAGALGAAFVTAQRTRGVAATAKHFPGLGAAAREQNTDLTPVTLGQPLQELRTIDEQAFSAPIAAGVDVVMASWAVYPALDAANPAGLSAAVVRGELRERIGFRGVTITDALEAGSLESFGDPGRRAVLAARAGMDLLLCSARDVGQGQATAAALAGALQDRTLGATGFADSLRRVMALRELVA